MSITTFLSPKLNIKVYDKKGLDYIDEYIPLFWGINHGEDFLPYLTDRAFLRKTIDVIYNYYGRNDLLDKEDPYWMDLYRFAIAKLFSNLQASLKMIKYRDLSNEADTYRLPMFFIIEEHKEFDVKIIRDFSLDLTLDEVKTLTKNQS